MITVIFIVYIIAKKQLRQYPSFATPVTIILMKTLQENYRPDKKDWKLDLRVNDTTELELFAPENPPKRPSYPEACGLRHLAFRVENIEQAIEELKKLGIACEPLRTDTFTGKKMTFFFDPDNLPLELHE